MFSRHRQGGDVHGDAAVHVESPDQEETATTHDRSAEKKGFLYTCVLIHSVNTIRSCSAKINAIKTVGSIVYVFLNSIHLIY